jgi:hypothetical protein
MEIADVLPELPVHETVNWVLEMKAVKIILFIYTVL